MDWVGPSRLVEVPRHTDWVVVHHKGSVRTEEEPRTDLVVDTVRHRMDSNQMVVAVPFVRRRNSCPWELLVVHRRESCPWELLVVVHHRDSFPWVVVHHRDSFPWVVVVERHTGSWHRVRSYYYHCYCHHSRVRRRHTGWIRRRRHHHTSDSW